MCVENGELGINNVEDLAYRMAIEWLLRGLLILKKTWANKSSSEILIGSPLEGITSGCSFRTPYNLGKIL